MEETYIPFYKWLKVKLLGHMESFEKLLSFKSDSTVFQSHPQYMRLSVFHFLQTFVQLLVITMVWKSISVGILRFSKRLIILSIFAQFGVMRTLSFFCVSSLKKTETQNGWWFTLDSVMQLLRGYQNIQFRWFSLLIQGYVNVKVHKQIINSGKIKEGYTHPRSGCLQFITTHNKTIKFSPFVWDL